MSRWGGRRHVAAAGLLLTLAVVPAPQGAATAAVPHSAAPMRTAAQTGVEVVLERLEPAAPTPGQNLQVAGTVVNHTDTRLSDVSVRLRVDRDKLNSRSEIALQSTPGEAVRDGEPVPDSEVSVTDSLDAGEQAGFTIDYPLDDLPLDGGFGVYALSIDALAGNGDALGSADTLLPWTPRPDAVEPTRLAWLWPLASTPSRDAKGEFTDDVLEREVASDGRLRSLVDAADGHDVTWAVDPELLESLEDMADGYTVRSGDESRPGKGGEDAADLIDRLRAATAGSADVMSLPYADPDLVALDRGGLTSDIRLASAKGKEIAGSFFGREVASDIAWPAEGFLDQPTLESLRITGYDAVVLSDQAAPVTNEINYTPTGRADLPTMSRGQDMTGLLADSTLSALVASDTRAPGSEVLTRQRFLAETAMITAERPNRSRTVLVAPPHRWSPDSSFIGDLLDATEQSPWIEQVSLGDLRAEDPEPTVDRGRLTYPDDVRGHELARSHVDEVAAQRTTLSRFEEILQKPERIVPRFESALLRAESSAWRTNRRRGEEFLDRVGDRLERDSGAVRIISGDLVTLSSTSGTIPVTIENSLSEAVTVSLRMTPRNRTRLSVEVPAERTIQPYRKTTIEVPAEAAANGLVVVDTTLTTPQGNPYGDPMAIRVRATNYGTLGTVVMAVAAAVLFLGAGIRLFRRVRAARDGRAEAVTQREKVGA